MSEKTPFVEHPYPSEDTDPWFSDFEGFAEALDGADYATREDRHLIFSGGGTVSWDGATGVLDWTADIQILAAITGRLWTIPGPDSVTLDAASGVIFYTILNRAPSLNTNVAPSAGNTVPGLANGNEALGLAVRVGNDLYLRTGVTIPNGTSITGFAPTLPGPVIVPPDLRTSSVIVGNSLEGDTTDDCDYLDVGDGVQLETALAAAGAGATPLDVFVRPGTYDFDAGAVVARLVIPAGVRVRGAGRESTVISTNVSGDCRAFVLSAGAVLEDIGVTAVVPTGLQVGAEAIISANADRAHVKRCRVEFTGGWAAIGNPAWAVVEAAFGAGAVTTGRVRFVDCEAVDAPHGATLGFGSSCYPFANFAAAATMTVRRCEGTEGDNPVLGTGRILVSHSYFEGADSGIQANQIASSIADNEITVIAAAGADSGIDLGADKCSAVNNLIECTTGAALSAAVRLSACSQGCVTGNRGTGNAAPPVGWPISIDIVAGSNNNVVTGNNFGGGAVALDAGAGNVVAMNL